MQVYKGRTYAIRLTPHQDLKEEIVSFVKEKNIYAGCIVTTVGSLEKLEIRLAGGKDNLIRDNGETYEITSLVGTLSTQGVHLHISLSDKHGNMIGGHLLSGCKIFTTAEIVIGELADVRFERHLDPSTQCNELSIIDHSKSITPWIPLISFFVLPVSLFFLQMLFKKR